MKMEPLIEIENRAGGNTRLHAAVLKRSLSAVKLILKVNSKINIKNFGNEVPLHYAAEFSGDEDNLMINDLLSNEETMKIFSDDQLTPVHIAGYFNQPGAINLFAKKGADLNIKSKTAVKDTPMTLAAALGSFEAVKALVENGADMNIGRADDLTSLMAACIKGKMNIVEYLIEEGVSLSEYDLEIMSENMSRNMFIHIIERSLKASVSNKNTSTVRLLLSTHKFDRSLLNDLMFEAVRKNSIDIVNLLLKEGCSLSIRTIDQCSLVYLAARFNAIDVLKYLIRKGIDVKSKTLLGDTTLHGAAYSSSVEAVNLLLKANVLMNISNSENEMPIHIAARENNLKLNDLLSNEEIINSYDDEGYTPIMYSVKYKVNPEIIKLFIKKGANVNLKAKDNKCDTALHLACKNDDLDAVKILLENNAAPNVKNVKKEFPIHIASTKNSYELNDLLSNNVNLNVYDQNGYTPIMHSVIKNIQLDVIELFIRKGSNINLPSKKKSGNTVLHMACCLGYVDLVKVLLEHNPDLTIRNSSNLTPLMMAEKLKKPEVVKCFTNALSKELPNLVTSERLEKAFLEKDEETVRKILSSGYGNVNKTIGCNLFNCVQYAVSQNLLNILILLEEMGGDLQIRNSNRETLLYVAASCNSFNVLKYLIDKGIDVNEVNIDKNTPLHAAAISQSLESVEFLLKAKALINVRNNANQLPIHIAATKNNIAINDILSTRTNLLLVDKNEMTPLHLAAEANCPDNIKLFIRKGVDVNLLQLPLKNTPLHLACCKNNLEAVEVLIDCKANVNIRNQLCKLTAFQIASTTNNVDVMRILLKPKMNITKIDSRLKSVNPTIPTYFHSIGRGCLSLANAVEILCNMSKIEREYMLNNAIKRDQYDLVELLLSFCDPQDLSEYQECVAPVTEAVFQMNIPIMRLLIEHGVDLTMVNRLGYSLLHIALTYTFNEIEMAEFLISKGISVNSKAIAGITPLHFAMMFSYNSIAKLIVKINPETISDKITCEDPPTDTELVTLRTFLSSKIMELRNLDILGKWKEEEKLIHKYLINNNSLHLAILYDNSELIQLFADNDADLNEKFTYFDELISPVLAANYCNAFNALICLLKNGSDIDYVMLNPFLILNLKLDFVKFVFLDRLHNRNV